MDVNRIAENYVVRQVFVLAGVIFLIFRGRLGDFFWPRLLGASLNYAFLGGRDGLYFSYADTDRGKPRLPWHRYGRGTDSCGFFYLFGLGAVRS